MSVIRLDCCFCYCCEKMVKMYGNKNAILELKQVKSGFLLSLLNNLFKNLFTEEFRHHVFKVQ